MRNFGRFAAALAAALARRHGNRMFVRWWAGRWIDCDSVVVGGSDDARAVVGRAGRRE